MFGVSVKAGKGARVRLGGFGDVGEAPRVSKSSAL